MSITNISIFFVRHAYVKSHTMSYSLYVTRKLFINSG